MKVQQIVILTSCLLVSINALGCYIESERRQFKIEKSFFDDSVDDSYRNECEVPRGITDDVHTTSKPTFVCDGKKIKPKCVCSYFNFKDGHSACHDKNSDSKTNMLCSECKQMSENESGPCQNGGIIKCDENDTQQLAIDLECQCPTGYEGKYCETHVVKAYKICNTQKCENGYKILEEDGQKFNCCNTDIADVRSLESCKNSGESGKGPIPSPGVQGEPDGSLSGHTSKNTGQLNRSDGKKGSISGLCIALVSVLLVTDTFVAS